MRFLADNPASSPAFGLSQVADRLAKQIEETGESSIAIGIVGSWGRGKTTLMKAISDALEGSSTTKCIWLCPWRYSGTRDVQSAVVGDITAQLTRERRVRSQAAQFVLRFIRRGALALIEMGLDEVVTKVPGGQAARRATDATGEAVADVLSEIRGDDVGQLAEQFEALVASFLRESRASKLVIFVDDIDRCLPLEAVRVLEAIKLYLLSSHTVWLVATDRLVVEAGMRNLYGEAYPGRSYLEKILQVQVLVPTYDRYAVVDLVFDPADGEVKVLVPSDCRRLLADWCEGNVRRLIQYNNSLVSLIISGMRWPENAAVKLLLSMFVCLQISHPALLERLMRSQPHAVRALLESPEEKLGLVGTAPHAWPAGVDQSLLDTLHTTLFLVRNELISGGETPSGDSLDASITKVQELLRVAHPSPPVGSPPS